MSVLARVKKNPVLKKLYRMPGVKPGYHLSLALAGAVSAGFPSRELTVIGVTGTKGKTTTVEILATMLEAAGCKVALLSSVHEKIGRKTVRNATGNSMPGRMFIQKFLRRARAAGCTHAVVEVTSEGTVQARHKFIEWDVAVITNIAPEHIESHGSFENYRNAKLSFLQYAVRRGAMAFVNADDEASNYFREHLSADRTISYSAKEVAALPSELFAGLPGEFNRQNVAAAAAVVKHLQLDVSVATAGLKDFRGVPGRMETVASEPARVVVDYAHTPDSLEAAFTALRASLPAGRKLIAVFGSCGGHRDKWKRPVMGEVASRYADHIILTDEDPYDEDPKTILRDIHSGIPPERKAIVEEIVDRKEAIRRALSLARPGDTVVMTGKGSETSIHVAGGKVVPWSDRETVLAILKES